MIVVNQVADRPLPDLLAGLFDQIREQPLRQVLDSHGLDGLRPSHLRVVAGVDESGLSITELAQRLGMTKQGCGQFVAALTGSGHLEVATDPADRRVRTVSLTGRGRALVAEIHQRLSAFEDQLARRIGPDRYATFRADLAALSSAPDSDV